MRPRHRGHSALAVAIVLALVAGGTVAVATGRIAVASAVRENAGGSLNETVVSPFTFVTRVYENVSLDTKVTVALFNGDTTGVSHTFTILNRSNFQVPSTAATSNLVDLINKAKNNTTGSTGTLANVSTGAEGATTSQTFFSPSTAGYYEFFCLVAGHFQLGMWGFVVFGEYIDPSFFNLGSSSPGPGLAVFIIIGTIVTLTVLAIVLGFVIGRRRGAEHEMPPERLGYPEPPTPEPQPAAGPGPPPY